MKFLLIALSSNFNSEANNNIMRISDQRFFEQSSKSWWTNIAGDRFEYKK